MFDPGNLELVGVQFGQAENKWGVLSVQGDQRGCGSVVCESIGGSGDLANEVGWGVSTGVRGRFAESGGSSVLS